jgi:hypothetical protein
LLHSRPTLAWGPIEAAVLRRSITLWLLIRVTIGVLLILGNADPLRLDARAVLLIVAAVGIVSWLDTNRRNESLLLDNLGTPRWMVHLLGLGPAAVLEMVLGILSRI